MENQIASKKPKAQAGLPPARGYAPLLILPTATPDIILKDVRAAGYVPILTNEPDKVKLLMGHSEFTSGDMLMSALYGISGDSSAEERSRMVKELYRRMLKREGA